YRGKRSSQLDRSKSMSVYDAKFIPAEVTAAISPTCTTRTCRTLLFKCRPTPSAAWSQRKRSLACSGKVLQRHRQDSGSGKNYPGADLTSRWTTNPVLYAAIAPSHFEERLPWYRPF